MQKNLSSYHMFQEQNDINCLNNRILNVVQLQILDLETNIRYNQKKGAMHIKESVTQIYNIFDQTEPIFRDSKALFLHETVKKLMNLFGIICFMLMEQSNQQPKDSNHDQGNPAQTINNFNNKDKQRRQKENRYEPAHKNIQKESQMKNTINKLGGIFLYNENYSRHIVNNGMKPFKKTQKYQHSKQELSLQVQKEINTSPFDIYNPDQILDCFNFKFKHGRNDPIITFHDELQSISNFFLQSRNEAMQFLNQTQHHNTLFSYDETSFQKAMSLMSAQKEDKIRKFTEKIQALLQSIKQKSEDSMKAFENKLKQITKCKQSKALRVCEQKQTQTDFKTDQQQRQKLAASVQQYEMMLALKERQVKQIFSKRLELQNQLSLRNREIYFLKLNREEKDMLIQSLNKKLKSLKNSRISIDRFNVSKQTFETTKTQPNYKQPIIKEEVKTPSEETSYEQIRKQKKMAKLRMIKGRRGSLNEDKVLFPKRLTQAELILKSISRQDQQQWNLSEITQNYREESDFDDESQLSSSTNIKKSIKSREQNFSNSISKNSSRQSNRSRQSIDYQERGSLRNPSLGGNMRRGSFANQNNLNIKTSPTSPLASRYSQSIQEQQNRQESSKIIQEQISQAFVNKLRKRKQNFRQSETIKKSSFAKERNRSENKQLQKQFGSFPAAFAQGISEQIEEREQTFKQSIYQSPSNNSLIKSNQKKSVKQSYVTKYSNAPKQKQIVKNQTLSIKPSQQVSSVAAKEINKQNPTNSLKKKTILSSNQYNLTIHPCQEDITTKVPLINELSDKQSQSKEEKIYSNLKSSISKASKQNYSSLGKGSSFIYRSAGNSTRFSTKATNSSHMQYNRSELNFRSIKNSLYQSNQFQKAIPYAETFTVQKKELIVVPRKASTKIKECNQNNKQNQKISANQSFKLTDESNPKKLLEDIKDRQAIQQAEEKEVRSLAMNCPTLHEFKNRVVKIHAKKCGHNCSHLQKLVNKYLKFRQNSKQKLCLPISNIHESIEEKEQFPTLRKKKN